MKAKNKLNSTFGMCVTDLLQEEWEMNQTTENGQGKKQTRKKHYKRIMMAKIPFALSMGYLRYRSRKKTVTRYAGRCGNGRCLLRHG